MSETTDLKVMALIPARGGSTGVPGKNIKPLVGKPLIGYTIELANASKFINRVVVATDCEKIAAVAREFGADIPFMRPAETAQKLSRAYDTYRYYVNRLQEDEDYRPDIVVLLFSTSYSKVLRDVDAAIEKLITTKCDWVFTVTESEHHPNYLFTPLDDDRMCNYVKTLPSQELWGNRQELPPVYRIDGNAMVTWTQNIENFTTYNIDMVDHPDTDVRYILCDQENAGDINTEVDFAMAELVMSRRLGKGG